jgi:3alpha(or 20beta)-hydroxysteroid dehydrogenase
MPQTKVVMITGAASGIGAATAQCAVAAGYRVIAADIDIAGAAETAARLGTAARAAQLDITSERDWQNTLEDIWTKEGRLDVLVNNAAIVHTGWARDLPLAAHARTLETNCMGAINGMMSALPRFKTQGFGHFITVASMVAFLPYPGLASYAAAKHALRAFHVALSIEQRHSPVAFTLVYPGATETPMLEKEARDDALALAFAGTPMPADDVAHAIVGAIETQPEEVYLQPERSEAVKALGVNVSALREYVEKNTFIGWQRLQERRERTRAT